MAFSIKHLGSISLKKTLKMLLSWDSIYHSSLMFLPFTSTGIIYYLINDLLHSQNLVFRADIKRHNSPIYQKYFVYLHLYIGILLVKVQW